MGHDLIALIINKSKKIDAFRHLGKAEPVVWQSHVCMFLALSPRGRYLARNI